MAEKLSAFDLLFEEVSSSMSKVHKGLSGRTLPDLKESLKPFVELFKPGCGPLKKSKTVNTVTTVDCIVHLCEIVEEIRLRDIKILLKQGTDDEAMKMIQFLNMVESSKEIYVDLFRNFLSSENSTHLYNHLKSKISHIRKDLVSLMYRILKSDIDDSEVLKSDFALDYKNARNLTNDIVKQLPLEITADMSSVKYCESMRARLTKVTPGFMFKIAPTTECTLCKTAKLTVSKHAFTDSCNDVFCVNCLRDNFSNDSLCPRCKAVVHCWSTAEVHKKVAEVRSNTVGLNPSEKRSGSPTTDSPSKKPLN